LVEQNSQGNFVPHGHQDIMHQVIGRPKHPDRVRATGKEVEIRQYFVVAPRNSYPSPPQRTTKK